MWLSILSRMWSEFCAVFTCFDFVCPMWNSVRGNADCDDTLATLNEEEIDAEASATDVKSLHKYDVFINHRRPDVKLSFAAQLSEALCNAGFNPFLDAKSIRQGRHVFDSIDEALSGACVHVAIFSKRYAESKYCLEELWDMLQTQKVILPVFYDVKPEDLRYTDRGPFAEGFQKHRTRGKVKEIEKWKEALREIAGRMGFRRDEVAGDENQLIRSIVVEVRNQMPVKLQSEKRLFGIEGSLKEVLQKVDAMGDNVGILGLCGMGGIGKTTLADELYRYLLSRGGFKVHSFLKDVRSNARLQLQQQLVRDLIQEDMGKTTKSYRHWFDIFKTQRALIIVDDIDNVCQFTNLIPQILQLDPGSRIVVTSRALDVLNCAMGPAKHKDVYEVKVLNCIYSRQLFNWHAFYSEVPTDEFRDLAVRVADACGGHPLALEIIGASLFDKKDLDVDESIWMDAIKSLKENDDILDKLKISYDTLPTVGDKAMFQDIACLLIGMRQQVALEIWSSCRSCSGYCSTSKVPHLSLRRLVDKSLVRLHAGELRMHDIIRDMGRDVVVKEAAALGDPGKRSHLWDAATATKVLRKNQGTDKVRGIKLSIMDSFSAPTAEQFVNMEELHLLVLDGCPVEGEDFSSWSQELRWLQWRSFPRTELPSHLKLSKLVVLDLTESTRLTRLWDEDALTEFPWLQRLVLKNCRGLEELPQNIGDRLPRLRIMEMENCSLIAVLPNSVGRLKYLVHLILSGCKNLTTLPNAIVNLRQLEKLLLDGCIKLKDVPVELGALTNLVELSLTNCKDLHELPSSLTKLWKLKELHMRSSSVQSLPDDFGRLTRLHTLSMSHLCNLPQSFERLKGLVFLDLENCKLKGRLPSIFGAFTVLKTLNLRGTQLVAIQALPQSMQHLDLLNCHQLIHLPSLAGMGSLTYLNLCNCKNLTDIDGVESLTALEEINLAGCTSIVQSRLHIVHSGRALSICYLTGSKVAVSYDSTWSEMEPASQLISYYGNVMGYLPNGMARKIKDQEWSHELLLEAIISSKTQCVAVIICVVAHDQGWSNFPECHGLYRMSTFQQYGKLDTKGSTCHLEVQIIRGDAVVIDSFRIFSLRLADKLNQVYLCTFRRQHTLLQMLRFGDKIRVFGRSMYSGWAITVDEGAICVIYGENDDQVVSINSKLLNKAQSKELCTKLGKLVLGDNKYSTQMEFLPNYNLGHDETFAKMNKYLACEASSWNECMRLVHEEVNVDTKDKIFKEFLGNKQLNGLFQPKLSKYTWNESWVLPEAGRGIITFTAECIDNVHVGISPQLKTQAPMYELVVGGGGNKGVFIRRHRQGHQMSRVPGGLLYPKCANQLWVSIDKRTSIIQIGRGEPYQDILSHYLDPDFITEARFVSFTTWDRNPITYSNISFLDMEGFQPHGMLSVGLQKEINLDLVMIQKWTTVPLHGQYTWAQYWKLPNIGRGVFSFAIESTKTIQIAISTCPWTMDHMYEIFIGETYTKIQRGYRPDLFPGWYPWYCEVGQGTACTNSFWVSIDDRSNIIQVGKGGPCQNTFFSWKDPDFLLESLYFSFTSSSSPITYYNVGIGTLS